jgi:hypothetical protein
MFNLKNGKSKTRGGEKMKGKMIFRVAVITCVLATAILFSSPAMAATSAPITVTATPAYVALTVAPATWLLNGITGSGVINPSTTYYSNPLGDTVVPASPVVDADCQFTLTNTSTSITDMFCNWADFTGGNAAMTNVNGVTAGATSFAAWSYCTGMATYATSKVLCQSTGSAATKVSLAPTTNIKFGFQINTQTNAWAGGASSTAVITVSLAAA